jgi:hypothetical protein
MPGQRRLVIRASRDLTQVLYLIEDGREEPLTAVPPDFEPEIEFDAVKALRKLLKERAEDTYLHRSIRWKKDVFKVKDILEGD